MRKDRFDWKEFLRLVATIAIPVALQNLLTTTGSMVDTIMIARLGERTVAGVGLVGQFTSLMFASYWGFVGGGMLFFAQYWGDKDERGITRAYGVTLTAMMLVGVLFTAVSLIAPEWVMRVYTDKPEIQAIGVKYLRIMCLSFIPNIISMAMASVLRSTERPRIPLYGAIGSLIVNISFNWILIFGRLGFPRLEVKGAAIATVISAVTNLAIIVLASKKIGYRYIFAFSEHFKWTKAFIKEYLKKCFPIICNELLIGVGNMVLAIVIGRQSAEAIAAVAVFRTLEGLVIGFFAGFSNAASVVVGKEVGAGNLRVAYERAKRLVYLCAAVIFGVCALMFAFHSPILHTMSLSGESYRIGTGILLIYCVAAVIRMCNWVQNDTYRSAGDATTGTVLEIAFMYALLIPATCLSGLVWKADFFIVFVCMYIDEPIRFIIMQRHMYSGKWIRPVTVTGQDAVPEFRAWLESRRKSAHI